MNEEEKKVIEHNSFNTSSGNGEYQITFETNNKNNYLFMQELARLFIDRNYNPKEFQRLKVNNEYLQKDCNTLKERIEKQQKELEKKDRIIDKMAGNVFLMNGDRGCTKQEIIEYFKNLVEKEDK